MVRLTALAVLLLSATSVSADIPIEDLPTPMGPEDFVDPWAPTPAEPPAPVPVESPAPVPVESPAPVPAEPAAPAVVDQKQAGCARHGAAEWLFAFGALGLGLFGLRRHPTRRVVAA